MDAKRDISQTPSFSTPNQDLPKAAAPPPPRIVVAPTNLVRPAPILTRSPPPTPEVRVVTARAIAAPPPPAPQRIITPASSAVAPHVESVVQEVQEVQEELPIVEDSLESAIKAAAEAQPDRKLLE